MWSYVCSTWIAVEEHPGECVNGMDIREMLMNKKDMSEGMAFILVRMLRHDEVNRELGIKRTLSLRHASLGGKQGKYSVFFVFSQASNKLRKWIIYLNIIC
jgi:hypothetical protein